jgi:hypothetical protein
MLLQTDFLPILENAILRNEFEVDCVLAGLALTLDRLRELELLLDSIGVSLTDFASESAN